MAQFLFIDESGHDRRETPCEVLAGVSVEDRDLWNLIEAIRDAEELSFGLRYSHIKDEFKGKKFLKRKVFKHAAQGPAIEPERRRALAKQAIESGSTVTRDQITALGQAKLAFVSEVLDIAARFHCRVFASIVRPEAPRQTSQVLRKDYAYLFERFFYFLEDRGPTVQGVVVFDELEKTSSKILLGQMEQYFLHTAKGRQRSQQVVPQPFFVHSDLTTLVQVADLVAYITAWGFRIPGYFEVESREELKPFAEQVAGLRYQIEREIQGNPNFKVWSIAVIDDLRGREDRERTAVQQKRQ